MSASEKDREAASVLLGPCTCSEAYTLRNKRDPSCVSCDFKHEAAHAIATARAEGHRAGMLRALALCDDFDAADDVAAALRAAAGEGQSEMKVGDRVRLTKAGREAALTCDGTKDWCLNPGVVREGPVAGLMKVKRDGKGKASRLEVWATRFWEPERAAISGEGKSHE